MPQEKIENSNEQAVNDLQYSELYNKMPTDFKVVCQTWISQHGGTVGNFLKYQRDNRANFKGQLTEDPVFRGLKPEMQRQCKIWMEKNRGTPNDFLLERSLLRSVPLKEWTTGANGEVVFIEPEALEGQRSIVAEIEKDRGE